MQTLTLDAIEREFTFDKQVGRYRYKESGKFVARSTVEALTRGRISKSQKDLTVLNDLLVQRKITLEGWQLGSAKVIKLLHIEQLLLARPLAVVQPEDYLAVGRNLKLEYQHLRGVAIALKEGTMTEAQFRARMNLYAKKSRVSYELGKQLNQSNQGKRWMRRHLGATDRHCASCVSYSARGWVGIGGVPLPCENCECGAQCRCFIEYSNTRPQA